MSLLLSSRHYIVYPTCWRMGSVGFGHQGKEDTFKHTNHEREIPVVLEDGSRQT